ncbi:DUF2029 domain-containing protein [Gordonia pseudamarae]|nr:DUF2029 domain-containing protein [Gordonia sp. (in: high G+C Gram-positive bacteria)]QHN28369.1 DUF2029 domain-containing protein [Gordonia pseudamarae]
MPSADPSATDLVPGQPGDVDAGGGFVSPRPYAVDDRTLLDRVVPTWSDDVVAGAATAIGGGLGRHAAVGRSRWVTPLRVVLALALCAMALGWFGKSACLQTTTTTTSAGSETRLTNDNQRQFTNLCYSDVLVLYQAEKLDRGQTFPYKTFWNEGGAKDGQSEQVKRYMEYPVLTGIYMYGAAKLAQWWEAAHENWGVPAPYVSVGYFNIAALGLLAFWLITIWATALTARTRIWSAWIVALSPLAVVHVFTNFDAIATGLLALALLSWSRRKPWLAGIFIGLGTAAKLYPLILLLVLLLLCWRAGAVREFTRTALAAVATWAVVNLPIAILYPSGWLEFIRFNADRGADPDSVYRIISDSVGFTWNIDLLNAVSLLGMVLLAIALAIIVLRAPTRPRLAQVAFLAVAGFLLINKVWSPQYSLWLVPLAVLAIPHTRLLFTWMIVDALVWIPRMSLFLDSERRWLPDEWFTATVVVRAVMVIVLCVVVLWQIWHPADDPVRTGAGSVASGPNRDRAGGVRYDDPAGGILDGAADRLGRWAPRRRSPVVEPWTMMDAATPSGRP